MRAVARRRLDDAKALCAAGVAERATGAMYIAGFAIEIVLKCHLLGAFPTVGQRERPAGNDGDAARWNLFWRQHDLDAIMEMLPGVEEHVREVGEWRTFAELVGLWSIQARYTSHVAHIREARDFVVDAAVRDGRLTQADSMNISMILAMTRGEAGVEQ